MALVRGMSMLSTRKRKVKITKAKLANYEAQRLVHNKWCKQNGLHNLRYSTVEEYINYCLGKNKPKKEFKPLVAKPNYRTEDKEYPSLTTGGHGGGTKKDAMQYTGTYVIGIATCHKSNAIPIINQQQAIEVARMAK